MNKKSVIIKLDDIKCREIVEKIKECTNIVFKFKSVIKKLLKYKILENPQIYIVRSESKTFEDDGNTSTPGYEYEVYWCFPYVNLEKTISASDILYMNQRMPISYLLFFKFTIVERIKDHKCEKSHFFKLYLTSENESRVDYEASQVACYNNNNSLDSMLNVQNLYFCIEKINEVWNKILLVERLRKELAVSTDISNIKEYIDKNCKSIES